MRMYDIIRRKRDGAELSPAEIRFFIQGYVNGEIPDYQVSAMLMAIYFRGMNDAETLELTRAMIQSGSTIDLSGIPGLKVDKHSTGGVGDKTSLVVGPLVAAAGVPVAKLSGRGLGHTGGTLDKLDAIPGFRSDLSEDRIVEQVKEVGIAIAGQTRNLVPADKLLYALRDVTATIENYSLIAASIMSKKIASGADRIVLDVKCGSGAFMKTLPEARELAARLVAIGSGMGRKTIAVISNMSEPLGNAVGNSVEIREVIDVLRGEGPDDVRQLCLELAGRMLVAAEAAQDATEARERLEGLIRSGAALEKFREMIAAQGGDPSVVDDPGIMPRWRLSVTLKSSESGYVRAVDAEGVGKAAMLAGAGREKKDQPIDYGAGVIMLKKVGDYCEAGDPLAIVYSNEDSKLENAVQQLGTCYSMGETPAENIRLILDVVEDDFVPVA
jgi:pyrimidine-nucleoside phosphorylase